MRLAIITHLGKNVFQIGKKKAQMKFFFLSSYLMFFKILNVIFYSYESYSIYFTLVILHLISPPTFKFLVCLIKWVGIFMVLNPVVFKR